MIRERRRVATIQTDAVSNIVVWSMSRRATAGLQYSTVQRLVTGIPTVRVGMVRPFCGMQSSVMVFDGDWRTDVGR